MKEHRAIAGAEVGDAFCHALSEASAAAEYGLV